MPWASFLLSLAILWGLVHFCHFVLAGYRKRRSSNLLPTLLQGRSRSADGRTNVVLHKFYLRVETPKFNHLHDALTSRLAQKTLLRHFLLLSYDLGSLAGMVGMVGAVVLLAAITFKHLVASAGTHAASVTGVLNMTISHKQKRDALSSHGFPIPPVDSVYHPPFYLIVPGVTVPLSHLPLLLFALLLSQVVHEAGHAIAASIEGIPLVSFGISLTGIFPSAFVSLPMSAIQSLSPRARLRIIASGAFHNLLLWLLLLALSWTGLQRKLWSIAGYEDVGHYGRVVVAIDEHSPLQGYIPVGSVITQLDDTFLVSDAASFDIWTSFLSEPSASAEHSLGWCADRAWFLSQAEDCCTRDDSGAGLCFSAVMSSFVSLEKCIPPLVVLQPKPPVSARRCAQPSDCGQSHICVVPRNDRQLLRIGIWIPPWISAAGNNGQLPSDSPDDNTESGTEKTVVWSGPREEILEEVQVSRYLARYSVIPLRLPAILDVFIHYVTSLTLSLYLFNLLPLPSLDGSQLLEAAIDFLRSAHFPISLRSSALDVGVALGDMESGFGEPVPQSAEGAEARWKQRTTRICQIVTSSLLAICIVFGMIHALH